MRRVNGGEQLAHFDDGDFRGAAFHDVELLAPDGVYLIQCDCMPGDEVVVA